MLSRRDVLFVLGALPAMTFAAESTAENYDVIVVGSGAAGLSAAVSAAQNGSKRVLVLEKTPTLGGHTILSTGYMSVLVHDGADEATYTKAVERIMEVFLKTGEGRGNPQLVRQLVEKSEDAHQWLSSLGLVWTPQSYQTLAGLTSRSFIPSLVRAGYDYIVTLNKAARMHGVTTLLNAEANLLYVTPQGAISGIRARVNGVEKMFTAKAIVLATGGFGGNVAMREHYDPRLDATFTTTADPYQEGADPATGDGIVLARKLGADLVDMDCIQIIPFWGGRLTDYVGADIYLTGEGRRFVNEGDSWKHIASKIWQLPNRECWVVTDSQSSKGASRSVKLMKDIVQKADSIEEMAAGMQVSPRVLKETLERYNRFVREGVDFDFGKTTFTQDISQPPYYYGKEHLYVHYCCGGLRFDERARVLRKDLSVIPGLYAAGEVTGGLHGADRVGGWAITDCIVYGRIAGKEAATQTR